MPINRALPILLTALALLATTGLIVMHAQAQHAHRLMAETAYLATGWDAQVVDATYEALSRGEGLPCPARVERTMQGKTGTYILTGEITRAQAAPGLDHPLSTCNQDGSLYLIRLTAGPHQQPHIYEGEILLDLAAVQADPDKLLRPAVRQDPALEFTTAETP